MTDLSSFIGREEVVHDFSDRHRIARLAALLDHETSFLAPDVLPPLGHWLCFLPGDRQSRIGPDGHPLRSGEGLLPNVDLPRRMWAGSRIRFLGDIALDAPISRRSRVIAADFKSGRSGEMLFVTLRHEIAEHGQAEQIVEEQDIVYRQSVSSVEPFARRTLAVEGQDAAVRCVTPDPIMLFRYSALTFNSHRIHYDRDYARDKEGYPGLVVQGPLMATLLMDHLLRTEPRAKVVRFNFRAVSPVFDGEEVLCGWSADGDLRRLRAIGPFGPATIAEAELDASCPAKN
ncbi:acyl-CoA dehydrogenase [Sphingobium xenophagum]|uniref:acyl-CoA dehydrogenase n=1 Tax=Sphingobium xenophagum TaxID=121428 RepID=UPI00241EBF6F|nr:acyl-CoA dehydrogenase [Sphingobium xenophagum]